MFCKSVCSALSMPTNSSSSISLPLSSASLACSGVLCTKQRRARRSAPSTKHEISDRGRFACEHSLLWLPGQAHLPLSTHAHMHTNRHKQTQSHTNKNTYAQNRHTLHRLKPERNSTRQQAPLSGVDAGDLARHRTYLERVRLRHPLQRRSAQLHVRGNDRVHG